MGCFELDVEPGQEGVNVFMKADNVSSEEEAKVPVHQEKAHNLSACTPV